MAGHVVSVFTVCMLLLLSTVQCAPQVENIFGQYRDQMKEAINACSQQEGVNPYELMEAVRGGKAPMEWSCVFKCIMQNSPGSQWMDENGTINLPPIAPAATVQCVNDSTSGVTDLCEKARLATTCWVSTRSQIFEGIRSSIFQG